MTIESKAETKERFNPVVEIGSFEDVKSSIIFRAFFKTIENKWGEEQNEEIAKEIREQDICVDEELLKIWEKIKNLADNNFETLTWLAFVVKKTKAFQDSVVADMVNWKNFSEDSARELLSEFINFYSQIENLFDISGIEDFVDIDIKEREKNLPELKNNLQEAIDFFNPKKARANKVVYIPTNPLERKQSGGGWLAGENYFVNAEIDNSSNQIHEFLHDIINPITENLQLNQEDEEAIMNLCPKKLKYYQDPRSILTEAIIRTYYTGFKPENKPQGDILYERMWKFFEDYKASGADNFEAYFLENYRKILFVD